ncbi:MAG TPA: Fur family transcriptional regulator [Mycobacteriales bacterium]|nr:Fur family transcriptional regulator [Mycobacteriales bacterium]
MASRGTDVAAAEVRASELLRSVGQRVTKPRLAVLTCVLAAKEEHLSADVLLERVFAADASVHRATVYRTLEGLTAAGVLQHVHLDRGLTAYHLKEAAGEQRRAPHLHAQCSRCGRVVDFPAEVLEDAAERVERATGFALDPAHVALSGRCADCKGLPQHP